MFQAIFLALICDFVLQTYAMCTSNDNLKVCVAQKYEYQI